MKKQLTLSMMLFGLMLMAGEKAAAQAVTVGGEIRTRTELRAGATKPLYDSLGTALVTVMRTRLNLAYTSNLLKAKVVMQDTRVFGQTAPGTQVATATTTTTTTTGSGSSYKSVSTSTSSTNAIGIYEAWGEYLLAPGFSFAIGRQALEYDDKRLFSASNWSNTGNAHDLALFKYASTDFIVHLGLAWNNASDVYQESAYTIASTYQSMLFLWGSKPLGNFNLTGLWVNEGYQNTTSQAAINYDRRWYRNTLGGNLGYSAGEFPVTFYGTGYYQFGHDASGKNLDAYLLAFKSQAKASKLLAVNLGADYFSGSKYDIATSDDHTFNKLFGSNHSFNGSMEYWKALSAGGLVDLYFGPEFSVGSKLKTEASYHAFSLAQQYSKGFVHKGLGSELDLTFTYPVSPVLALQGGWSGYFQNGLEKTIKSVTKADTKFPQWAFIMITFKPTFLSVK